jgi:mono/diheme cytochrome c family protein
LVGRHFDQAYITNVVTRGIPDTGMPSFATRLPRPDLVAVIAYVATLNGITSPNVGMGGAATVSNRSALTGEAARGARLFSDAVRSFGRCSTCHEVGDVGTSVAAPIAKAPATVQELKALATPNVKAGTIDSESMPVLVLSEGRRNTVFYDLTSVPPVQRNAEPGTFKFTGGTNWRHSAVITAYDDSELSAILAYLHAVIKL